MDIILYWPRYTGTMDLYDILFNIPHNMTQNYVVTDTTWFPDTFSSWPSNSE